MLFTKEDYHEITRSEIKTLDSYKKVIIGFSEIHHLRDTFNKNRTMDELNRKVLDKGYKDVEDSLSHARNSGT